MVKVRMGTEEVAEGILVSRMTLSMERADGGADIKTAQGRPKEVMAVVETVGRHQSSRMLLETFDGDVERLPSDREPWLYLGSPSGSWTTVGGCPA